jgi:hypothetical protein
LDLDFQQAALIRIALLGELEADNGSVFHGSGVSGSYRVDDVVSGTDFLSKVVFNVFGKLGS